MRPAVLHTTRETIMQPERRMRSQRKSQSDSLIPGALCRILRHPDPGLCLAVAEAKVNEGPGLLTTFEQTTMAAIMELASTGVQKFEMHLRVKADNECAELREKGQGIYEQVREAGYSVEYSYRPIDFFPHEPLAVVSLTACMFQADIIDTCRVQPTDRLAFIRSPKFQEADSKEQPIGIHCLRAVRLLLQKVPRQELHAILPESLGQLRVAIPSAHLPKCEAVAEECGLPIRDVGSYGSRRM